MSPTLMYPNVWCKKTVKICGEKVIDKKSFNPVQTFTKKYAITNQKYQKV